MFSQFAKRLQDSLSLDAVEQITASGVSSVADGARPNGSAGAAKQTTTSSHRDPYSSENARTASQASLAESSLSGFRRSMTSQRPASPSHANQPRVVKSPSQNNKAGSEIDPPRRPSTLEERLRASLTSKPDARAGSPVVAPPKSGEAHDSVGANQETDPFKIPLPTSPPPELGVPTPLTSPKPVFTDPLSPSLPELQAPCPRPHSQTHSALSSFSSAEGSQDSPSIPQPRASVEQVHTASFQAHESISNPPDTAESMVGRTVISPPLELSESVLQRSEETLTPEPCDLARSASADDRLGIVEKRFSDMSSSFKRLQAERNAADKLLKSFSPSLAISDLTGLENYFASLTAAANTATEDIKKLTEKLRIQEERIEELHDTHRSEGRSRSEKIDLLQRQRGESEALLADSQAAATGSAVELEKVRENHKGELAAVQSELEKARKATKEEEEKRVKAISLLKTVRTKLVNTEKELEDANQERTQLKEDGMRLRDKERSERERLETEIQKLKDEKAKESARLWTQFEADLANQRLKTEKEISAKQSQFELQIINLKATHDQELSTQDVRISQLEATDESLSRERDSLFDQLQMRQAELESSRSHQESLENQVTELRHLLREANDKVFALTDEVAELRRQPVASGSGSPVPSFANNLQMVADIERRYESKVFDLRQRMEALERERSEVEEEWSRNLTERSREIDRLRAELLTRDSVKGEEVGQVAAKEQIISVLKEEIKRLDSEKILALEEMKSAKATAEQAREAENFSRMEQSQSLQRVGNLEKEVFELRSRENNLRANNKTLREELRKVQSSAALLERGRNPGIGYWASKSRSNLNGQDSNDDRPNSPRVSSPTQSVFSDLGSARQSEEEVNLEYLRNIILQFLEHKEMRPHLVRVLSVILHFTPAETRRLVSKV